MRTEMDFAWTLFVKQMSSAIVSFETEKKPIDKRDCEWLPG